jgi:hypothetical protein
VKDAAYDWLPSASLPVLDEDERDRRAYEEAGHYGRKDARSAQARNDVFALPQVAFGELSENAIDDSLGILDDLPIIYPRSVASRAW